MELFIALIEGEASLFNHDEARISNNAWCLIDPVTETSPASVWKNKFKERFGDSFAWADLKADLMQSFGRQSAYTLSDNVMFLQSLSKGQVESHKTFLLRVQWVMNTLGDNCTMDKWAKLLYLTGLCSRDLTQIQGNFEDKSVEELSEVLSSSDQAYPVHSEVAIKEEEDNGVLDSLENFLASPSAADEEIVEEEKPLSKRRLPRRVRNGAKKPKFDDDEDFEVSSGDEDDFDECKEELEDLKTSSRPASNKRKGSHPCKECDEVFSFKSKLSRHMRECHDSDLKAPRYCGVCKVGMIQY